METIVTNQNSDSFYTRIAQACGREGLTENEMAEVFNVRARAIRMFKQANKITPCPYLSEVAVFTWYLQQEFEQCELH